ncbi:MAG: response regulator, partial [Candidatus Dechloromonas phosphoritropha]
MTPPRPHKLPAILVIDDEVRSQEALRRTLEEDFEVFSASGAAEGMEILQNEQSTADIRIVLCDQRMPGMTGVEFLKQVRDRWPDVIRIILSGYTAAEDIIAGVNEAGIWQYLLKPWQPEQLLLTLQR